MTKKEKAAAFKLAALVESMAQGYVNFLYADNGVYSTSHIYLINTLKAIPRSQHTNFHERVSDLVDERDKQEEKK